MGTYCLVALAVSPHYPADMGYMVPDHPTDTRTAALDVIVRWAEHLPQPGIHAALRELAMDLDARPPSTASAGMMHAAWHSGW